MGKFDVVIIGGGLSGLSAALTLCSDTELNVLLLEKERIGANQTVRAVYTEAVKDFGLEDSVLQDYSGYIFHGPLGDAARFDYGRVAMSGIDYQKACDIIFRRATERGLNFIRDEAVGLIPGEDVLTEPLIIRLASGDELQTEVLVDASGFGQWGAGQLGIKKSYYYSICYGELLSGLQVEDEQYVRLLAPSSIFGNGGGWFYPVGPEAASFGYSIVTTDLDVDRKKLSSGYAAAKNSFKPFSIWMKGSKVYEKEGGVVPLGRIGKFTSDRIIIIGDAAGQANPWAVEGCRPALYNGRKAGDIVLGAFKKKDFSRRFLSAFDKIWEKTNGERFWREASYAEVKWFKKDVDWEKFISAYRRISSEKQLRSLKENEASLFEKIFAVAGYVRRKAVKKLKQVQ